MPLYEFQCPKCGHRFERIQKFSDPDPKRCPECGAGKIARLLHAPAVQFKGSGWYVTDYARKGAAKPAEEKPAESSAKTEEAPAKSEHKKHEKHDKHEKKK